MTHLRLSIQSVVHATARKLVGAKYAIIDLEPNSRGQIKQHKIVRLPQSQSQDDPPRYDEEQCFIHSPNWGQPGSHVDNRAFIKAVVKAVKEGDVSVRCFTLVLCSNWGRKDCQGIPCRRRGD
jgi:hypothetical protein